MNVLLDHADRDGHDQLAALMAQNRHPPIGETLEFYLVELERGRVVFEWSPSRKVLEQARKNPSSGRLIAGITSII